jgi:PAS domain S-box-containing protein
MRTGLSAEQRLQTTYRLLESLQESHDQYYRLVEAISDIVFEHDANGLRFLNPAWTNILGHGQAASLGRPLLDFVSQPDRELLDHWLHETRENPGESRKVELRLNREDGVELWAEISGGFSAVHRQHTGIIRDIDSAKIAERALIESERRFRQMADAAPVMIWIAGLDTLCHYFNKTWLDFTGRSLAQEQGNGWAEGVHPEDMDRCLRIYLDAFKKGQSFTMDYRLRRHDGVYRWIQDHGAPQYDEKGQLLGYIGSCIDVTERVQAEELFRGLVEASPVAMLLVDDQGRIELANEQLAVMFGYAPSELVGQPVEILTPAPVRLRHPGYRDEFLHHASPRPMGKAGTVNGLRRAGQTFPAEIGLSPLTLNGRTHVIAVVVDMTERQRHEQQILDLNRDLEDRVRQRTTALEEASAAKSKFLAHMSHEIRTPLNAVLGLSQLLGKEPLQPGQQAMLRHITESGELLLHIVNDILDLSKIEAGELSLERRPFHVEQVVDNIMHMVNTTAQTKGLSLLVDSPPDLPERLLGDAMRLEQVLLNLLSNAIKFTEQGEVGLAIRALEATAAQMRLRFEISDSGIGLDEAAQARLFRPFTQADDSITRRFGGTGLGLSISKHLVQHMGGIMGLRSAPGQGSTFWFEIPFDLPIDLPPSAHPLVSTAPEPATPDEFALHGLRVLAVDDNRINLMVAGKALEQLGILAETAGDGQQALDRLRAGPTDFDAVLMDIQMPVMDGLTATREIRRDPALRHLPVIALSAGVLPEEREAALAAGVNDFLGKPLKLENLKAVLYRFRSR